MPGGFTCACFPGYTGNGATGCTPDEVGQCWAASDGRTWVTACRLNARLRALQDSARWPSRTSPPLVQGALAAVRARYATEGVGKLACQEGKDLPYPAGAKREGEGGLGQGDGGGYQGPSGGLPRSDRSTHVRVLSPLWPTCCPSQAPPAILMTQSGRCSVCVPRAR